MPSPPVAVPPLNLPNIDWSRLRLIDRSTPLVVGGPHIPNPEILRFLQWLWRAEDATRTRLATVSWLGSQTSPTLAEFEGDSFVTRYANGDLWAIGTEPDITATFIVFGAIRDRYRSIGDAKSLLGHVVSEEMPILDNRGRYQRFSNGEMYWSPTTGASEVYGDIFSHYASVGKVGSWLGYPLTGELPAPQGRMNGFEHGQIIWRASDRHIDAISFRDQIMAKLAAVGGIQSPLGLPLNPNLDLVRSGNAFTTSFRGGTITIPFDQPSASGLQTTQVELWFRGLECQVRQESSDEIVASFGCFIPSTLAVKHDRFSADMGKQNARIVKRDSLLYSGPPAMLYVSTGLHEDDEDNPFHLGTGGTGDHGWYESAPTSMQRFGAPLGPSAAEAAQRESIVDPLRYKIWFQLKYFEDWNAIDRRGSDVYPPGFLHIPVTELQQQPAIHRLVRLTDDNKTLNYTHSLSVSAVDDGGDTGVYAFYFEVKVTQLQNVI